MLSAFITKLHLQQFWVHLFVSIYFLSFITSARCPAATNHPQHIKQFRNDLSLRFDYLSAFSLPDDLPQAISAAP